MNWVRLINHSIDYMEEHLSDTVTLADIAKSVNLSAFHFQRAFSLLTGMSPAEYLRNRRLSQAGAELADGTEKVIDVALKYGYDTPESFSKAFTRYHGVTPIQVKSGSPVRFMNRYTVRITIEGGGIMKYRIEKWDATDLLVHARDFHAETSGEEIPAFWEEYYGNEMYRKIPGYLGVCAQQKAEGDIFRYGIGCKASDAEGVPEGFEILHIPEYTWAVFTCVGPTPKAVQEMWDKIYREWLPVADYELIPDYEIENYLPGNPASRDYVSEICIPVKKNRN